LVFSQGTTFPVRHGLTLVQRLSKDHVNQTSKPTIRSNCVRNERVEAGLRVHEDVQFSERQGHELKLDLVPQNSILISLLQNKKHINIYLWS
jgi:hypothetical protein